MIKLELNENEVRYLMMVLAERPLKESYDLFNKLRFFLEQQQTQTEKKTKKKE